MAIWAYECRACGSDDMWLVSRQHVDEILGSTRIVRVKTGAGWQCAVVDRSRALAVDAMLLREVIASDAHDCPECAAVLTNLERLDSGWSATTETAAEGTEHAEQVPGAFGHSRPGIQAAAISIDGHELLVVLVRRDLILSPGESDMVIADLRARFGCKDLVLMGQDDDGTPHYHGDAELVRLLAFIPVDRMPWKIYN